MTQKRPLSPHLQVYRLPFPAILSITHRISGVILAGGSVVLCLWLILLAGGAQSYAIARVITSHFLGQIALFFFTVALFYHGCNGVRHLFWDSGRGYDMSSVYKSGWAVVIASFILSIGLWIGFLVGV